MPMFERLFGLCLLVLPLAAAAQSQPQTSASAAAALLDRELPMMNKAVAVKDRAYFGPAQERVQSFLSLWQRQQGAGVLEQYPACTDAVTDFLIVGLCSVSPRGSICEPATFYPKVARNIARCRELAQPDEPDPLADIKKGQPADVAELIDRLAGCNHWSGEEPYDADRRKEIASAMKELGCERLEKDEAAATKRHANNPDAIRALKQARELSL